MSKIFQTALPESAFLTRYVTNEGAYVDCFRSKIEGNIDLNSFANAFFDTWIFRIERSILGLFAGSSTNGADVLALASGASDQFAIWHVLERSDHQMLLAVGHGPIRTWLMCEKAASASTLYFGSAVLPTSRNSDGVPKIGFTFRVLMGFHKMYSRALLAAARRKLNARPVSD